MFERKDHVKKFLRYMNSRHRNIQFTSYEESNDKILFLDISITRSNKLVLPKEDIQWCLHGVQQLFTNKLQ